MVVTTIAPERAPTGIVTVMAVDVMLAGSVGVMFTPFNFTLSTELNPDPLIVTVHKTGPEVIDKPPDALIRGKTVEVGV